MSLFNKLKDSNLKYLKWGQTGTQGDSTVPYIVTDINNVNSLIRYGLTREDEGILRGGRIGSRNASDVDTIRIKRFLEDPLKGPFFIYKQKILQQSNPSMETKGNDKLAEAYGGYTRFYNDGKNTLAQVSLTASGIHIARHGENSFSTQGKYTEVMDSINFGYFSTYIDNRLYKLYNKLFNIDSGGNKEGIGLPYASIKNNKIEYNFEPNNSNGLGKTTIRRFTYSGLKGSIINSLDKSKNKINQFSNDYIKYTNFSSFFGIGNVAEDESDTNSRITPKKILKLEKVAGGLQSQFIEYNDNNKSEKQKPYKPFEFPSTYSRKSGLVENQKSPNTNVISRGKTSKAFYDYDIKNTISSYVKGKGKMAKTGIYGRDDSSILEVKFTQIDPFTSKESATQTFSGYINGYNETYSSNWNDIKYNGRAEFLYNFVSHKKTASFNLQIPIFRAEDLIPTHILLKILQNGLAGKYNNNRLGGVINKIKLGYYLNNQYCIINSLNIKIPDDASWDWGIGNLAYSTLIEASFNITIIDNKISI
jgi:hypothetical protein